jgi:hypothetical protein
MCLIVALQPLSFSYKYVDIVPTHVHPNFNTLHFADIGDNYVPYNKPGSIKHWCVITADVPEPCAPSRPSGRARGARRGARTAVHVGA